VHDAKKREEIREGLGKLQYKECKFQPSINPVSRALASQMDMERSSRMSSGSDAAAQGSSVHERLHLHATTANSRSRMEDHPEMQGCTFRPETHVSRDPRWEHVKAHYSKDDPEVLKRIAAEEQEKLERLHEERREKEFQELQGCTFAPEVHQAPNEGQKPVVIRGLGRFFELREMTARQQREKEAGEKAADKGAKCIGVTVPQPFQLSASTGRLRKKVEQEEQQRNQRECTFWPATVEAKNRAVVNRILGETSVSSSGS